MALEDRIRGLQLGDRVHASVEEVLGELRTRVEGDLHHMVDQLVKAAAEEREEAIATASRAAFDEGSHDGARQAADAEARINEIVKRAIGETREQERQTFEQQRVEARSLADAAATQAAFESGSASLGRLLASVRALDGATSLTETLDALALAAARDAARAAVLVVRNDRLTGWKLMGFGERDSQPKAIDLGLNEGGVIGLAVSSSRAAVTRDGETHTESPAFAELTGDDVGTAAPIVVGGRVVAVLYADNHLSDERAAPLRGGWCEVIEVLARHAARCLEALTVQRTATAAPPRFWVPPPGGTGSAQPTRAADPGASTA